jgi:hypothetical protein
MIINDHLQRLLKEVGVEKQNGFPTAEVLQTGAFCICQAFKSGGSTG